MWPSSLLLLVRCQNIVHYAIRSCHFGGLFNNDAYLLQLIAWHLAGTCFLQLGRLARCCCCLRGRLFDGSDTNDTSWMMIILMFQDVLLASSSWYALHTMQWTSQFFWSLLRVMNTFLSQEKGRRKAWRK